MDWLSGISGEEDSDDSVASCMLGEKDEPASVE